MSGLPLARAAGFADLEIEGRDDALDLGYYQLVLSDYFRTMRIPLVAGRAFEPADTTAGPVAVVNETLAKTVWPGRDPLGQRVRPDVLSAFGAGRREWHTVIGVAKDVRQGLARAAESEIYLLGEQHAMAPVTINVAVRTELPAAALAPTVERVVRDVDPAVPVVRLRDMDAVVTAATGQPRLLAQLLTLFGGLALLLAAVGTYGVLSYAVAARRKEIGVRIALGASGAHVVVCVMGEGLALIAAGVVVGLAGVATLDRLIASLLFGLTPTDVETIAVVTTIIVVVAACACWLPAWRASRLDPNLVLRAE
jgi:predicted permease